jgi:transposase
VHDTGLHRHVGPRRSNRGRESFEAVAADDQRVRDTTVAELGEHAHPLLRTLEFRKFLDAIDNAVPAEFDVHVVLDNSSTHKTPDIHRWLLRHPRFTFHFTPTSSSWLNLLERWFAELTRKLLQRSAHRTVAALTADLDHWIQTWNEDPKPFVWHKTADQILDGLKKYLTNL